jgi:hypothetical protein
MKTASCLILLAAAILAGPALASAQTSNPSKLRLRGIGLDSTFAQVVKALGKPRKDGPATDESCAGGKEKDVEYDGVSFHFMNGVSKKGKVFEMVSFTVTSPKYVVSGVKIGDSAAAVRRIFGKKFSTDKDPDTGETIWLYSMSDREGPGTTVFRFKNGKLSAISSDYLVC